VASPTGISPSGISSSVTRRAGRSPSPSASSTRPSPSARSSG
jgi:hypothetical protein